VKQTREDWLNRAVDLMRNKLFAEARFKVPSAVRISVGFPSTKRGGRIGECWNPANSGDKHSEIFIHPKLDDAVRVLDVTAHELIHAMRPQASHGKQFKEVAVAIGLEGKMTATVAGEALTRTLKDYAQVLGPYPHACLNSLKLAGEKKQGTRLLKITCPACGYTARTTAKWLDIGLPTCVCGTDMESEDKDEQEDD